MKRILLRLGGIPGPFAYFYNFLPARILQPTYERIVQELSLKNEGVLVDIGTGPGNLAKLIAQKYPNLKVIGIDVSQSMIKIANKKKDLPNLEFKVQDAESLEFSEGSIDYVISTFSFHHFTDHLKVLNEIYRVLKKGGVCVICDGYSEAEDEYFDEGMNLPFKNKIVKFFVKKIFSLHGFSKKEYEIYVRDLVEKSDFRAALFRPQGIYMKIEMKKI